MAGDARHTVLHVVNCLSTGGAQTMLHKLATGMDRREFAPVVVSILHRGELLLERMRADGVPVWTLSEPGGRPSPAALARLRRIVKTVRPTLVQGWQYYGNLAATAARRAAPGRVPLVWNVRHSVHDLRAERRSTRLLLRLGARLSPGADAVVYNAHRSAAQHEALGFSPAGRRVVPNGFDCARFRPDPAARAALRDRLGIPRTAAVVGLVARNHPMKDHAGFLRAARALLDTGAGEVHFVLVGEGVTDADAALAGARRTLGLEGRAHLLGEQADVAGILAGLDVATLCSAWGEGFPNVVGEAMACQVPCVVTDVGDSALVVGETGLVVPPGDPAGLARAIGDLLARPREERERLGRVARQRVLERFSLEAVAAEYAALYRALLAGGGPGRRPAGEGGGGSAQGAGAPGSARQEAASGSVDATMRGR